MSYKTISKSANDPSLRERITACCAAEGNPDGFNDVLWPVCTAADIEAAYASALAAENPDPGGDESVITDGMILANVQPNLPLPDSAE